MAVHVTEVMVLKKKSQKHISACMAAKCVSLHMQLAASEVTALVRREALGEQVGTCDP